MKECYYVLKNEGKFSNEEFNPKLQTLKDQIEGGLSKLEAKEQKYKEFIQELHSEEKKQAEEVCKLYATEENNYLSVIIDATNTVVRIKREFRTEERSVEEQDEGQR